MLGAMNAVSILENLIFRNDQQRYLSRASVHFSNYRSSAEETAASIQVNGTTATFNEPNVFFPMDKESKHRFNHYSGMWYAHRDVVREIDLDSVRNLEGASFACFRAANAIAMASDWLDFCVEHLSKYWRHFAKDFNKDDETFHRVLNIVSRYVDKIEQDESLHRSDSPARQTVAVLPFFATEQQGQTYESLIDFNSSSSSLSHKGRQRQKARESILTMQALVATVTSLYRAGIGRVVVVGRRRQQPDLVTAAFKLIQRHVIVRSGSGDEGHDRNSTMELAYLWGLNETTEKLDKVPLPKFAIRKLQLALNGDLDESEIRSVLGKAPSQWKYVYFSEPDLILHLRPSVLSQLRGQLDRGNVVSAWRLHLTPHEADFPHYRYPSRMLPIGIGNFSDFVDLDPRSDSCCDGGNYWPGLDGDAAADDDDGCRGRWYACGFKKRGAGRNVSHAEAIEAHRRLLEYPMIRLRSGLGVPVVHNHARLCRPSKAGTCTQTTISR